MFNCVPAEVDNPNTLSLHLSSLFNCRIQTPRASRPAFAGSKSVMKISQSTEQASISFKAAQSCFIITSRHYTRRRNTKFFYPFRCCGLQRIEHAMFSDWLKRTTKRASVAFSSSAMLLVVANLCISSDHYYQQLCGTLLLLQWYSCLYIFVALGTIFTHGIFKCHQNWKTTYGINSKSHLGKKRSLWFWTCKWPKLN